MLKKLTVKTKLLIGIGLPVILMALSGLSTYSAINSMKMTNKWVEHTHNVLGVADEILKAAVDMETGMRGFVITGKDEFLEPYNSGKSITFALIDELKITVSDNPPQVSRLGEIQNLLQDWQKNITEPYIQQRRNVLDANAMNELITLVSQAGGKQYFDHFRELITEFSDIEKALMIQRKTANEARIAQTESLIMMGIMFTAILSLFGGLIIIRDLLKTLGEEPDKVNAIIQQVAKGNLVLTDDNHTPSNCIYGSIKNMASELRVMVVGIQKTVDDLTTSAKNTSMVAETTSDSVLVQLSETTEVATAIEQIHATVKEVAQNVLVASNASNKANKQATEGRNAMTLTVTQMGKLKSDVESASHVIKDLEENASEINSIVEVIKGVAEQTNLLALNAAIEAARAGEQGRGFAVVADEVRSLAERTQKSTEEINQMIDKLQTGVGKAVKAMCDSQKRADSASEQVENSNLALEGIQASIERINDMNTQISNATEEQGNVVEKINQNVIKVHSMAEKTSVGAKEALVTSTNLSSLSSDLQALVSNFKA